MRKIAGVIFVMLGAVLILSALLLFLHNEREEAMAGEAARSVMQELRTRIAETQTEATQKDLNSVQMPSLSDPSDSVPTPETEGSDELAGTMATIQVAGYEYIGFLEIPALTLELPILADWDEARLKTAPCRHFGSADTDDLVIAGHNYKNHFGNLHKLRVGDIVTFTDTAGKVLLYSIGEIRTLDATAVEEVQQSDWPLILYTCTYTGKARLMVGCGIQ